MVWATPFTVTSSWSFDPLMIVLGASGVPAATVAPADDWVTVMVWSPAARPGPAAIEVIPRAAPPEPTRPVPEAATSLGDATVPAEIWVDPTASWPTLSVSVPARVPDVTLAVATEEFDEAAENASLNAEGSARASADCC